MSLYPAIFQALFMFAVLILGVMNLFNLSRTPPYENQGFGAFSALFSLVMIALSVLYILALAGRPL